MKNKKVKTYRYRVRVFKSKKVTAKDKGKKAFKIQNQYRKEKGVAALEWSDELYEFCLYRLKTSGFDRHENLVKDENGYFGNYARFKHLLLGENLYSGSEKLPGFAIGYDGQGYFYDKDDADFIQKGKGIYVVAGKEILFPSLNLNIGLNLNDFKEPCLLGFVGASFVIVDEVLMFMTEYDNIGKGAYARANVGLRLWITENFDLDFMLRNFTTTDKEKFGCERIFKVSYQSKF